MYIHVQVHVRQIHAPPSLEADEPQESASCGLGCCQSLILMLTDGVRRINVCLPGGVDTGDSVLVEYRHESWSMGFTLEASLVGLEEDDQVDIHIRRINPNPWNAQQAALRLKTPVHSAFSRCLGESSSHSQS